MKKQLERENEWLYFAGEDMRSAEVLLKGGIYSQSCYHSHQCVEKSLKALIIRKSRTVKRIHDLNELCGICIAGGCNELKNITDEISDLNLFYVPMKYPDGAPGSLADRLPNKKDALTGLKIAEKIYAITMKILKDD